MCKIKYSNFYEALAYFCDKEVLSQRDLLLLISKQKQFDNELDFLIDSLFNIYHLIYNNLDRITDSHHIDLITSLHITSFNWNKDKLKYCIFCLSSLDKNQFKNMVLKDSTISIDDLKILLMFFSKFIQMSEIKYNITNKFMYVLEEQTIRPVRFYIDLILVQDLENKTYYLFKLPFLNKYITLYDEVFTYCVDLISQLTLQDIIN